MSDIAPHSGTAVRRSDVGTLVRRYRPGQSLTIGRDVRITILWVKGDMVRLSVDAPPEMKIQISQPPGQSLTVDNAPGQSLTVGRSPGQSFTIGRDIRVTILWVKGNLLQLAVEAPREIEIQISQ